MVNYEIKQKEMGVKRAYMNLMNHLNECITLRAKEGLPFTSLVGFKRQLYKFKKVVMPPSESLNEKENTSFNEGKGNLQNNNVSLLVEDVFNKMGVDVLDAVKAGLIGRKELSKALIKYDYEQMAKQGRKYKDIKAELSEKYGVSVSSIEKLVYRKGSV